ncbi:MAG: hypothetical protein LC808_02325 [Actinobacteria bacterium]|nr:hypothetical protein [Actinomycetota bacterium]
METVNGSGEDVAKVRRAVADMSASEVQFCRAGARRTGGPPPAPADQGSRRAGAVSAEVLTAALPGQRGRRGRGRSRDLGASPAPAVLGGLRRWEDYGAEVRGESQLLGPEDDHRTYLELQLRSLGGQTDTFSGSWPLAVSDSPAG